MYWKYYSKLLQKWYTLYPLQGSVGSSDSSSFKETVLHKLSFVSLSLVWKRY